MNFTHPVATVESLQRCVESQLLGRAAVCAIMWCAIALHALTVSALVIRTLKTRYVARKLKT
ncbi:MULTISPECIES: hypothetical protein [Microbulbifer]|uniref:Uncharacterized protein n=1 Tax=Microbulbifer celer TaxID=435905 RepID=A0ABW3UBC5_9GAMM|nr:MULTISPECIES: hypothetical protein [Microbulbifer]UFN55780.1 hypothetical protein LPW13_09320 [Microbulbifer celer]